MSSYNFSEFVKQDLMDFMENVKAVEVSNYNKLWPKILSNNGKFINNVIQSIEDDEIILISDSQEKSLFKEKIENENLNKTNNEIDNIMKETLLINSEVEYSSEVIERLNKECIINNNLLLDLLKHNSNNKAICHLGEALINSNANEIILMFFRDILTLKLKEEYNEHVVNLTNVYLCNHWHNVQATMIDLLCNYPTTNLCHNLNALTIENKEKLLRCFVLNCTKLEQIHFEVLLSLLSEPIDITILRKLTEHMVSVAANYTANKLFGKLIVTLIKLSGKHVKYIEEQITFILNDHKTVWKLKGEKLLALFENVNFTQSFSYY